MEDPNDVVNQSATATDAQAQETQGQEGQVASGQEDVQQSSSAPRGQEAFEAVDETGVPYKNRYMETQRKLAELTDRLPQMIEETIVKKVQTPQEKTYTIEELEQIALQSPHLRPQVEAEKLKLQEQRFARLIDEREKKQELARQNEMIKMRTEQSILSDPAFQECFTTDALGNKNWRMDHPLTNMISEVMRSPELANRPDALRIASDIAYGRYMRDVAVNNGRKAQMLKTAVKQEQRKTMVESGVPAGAGSGDGFAKAKEELARTGSKQAADNAIRAYLNKNGFLKG
jgi:hypothetical protein